MSNLSTVQQVLITSLEGSIERLENDLGGLTYDQLDLSADREAYPGTWTIREIIHHLADDGDVWSLRIKQAIATPGITVRMEGYPGNERWAGALDFEDRDAAPALRLVIAHCAYLIELLIRFAGSWDRTIRVIDVESGTERELSVLQMVQMLVEHMEEHMEQIENIREFNRV
jgi:hypothetical protein